MLGIRLLSLHSESAIASHTDRIVKIRDGKIEEDTRQISDKI